MNHLIDDSIKNYFRIIIRLYHSTGNYIQQYKKASFISSKKNKEVLNLNVGNVLRCHHSKFTNVTNVAVQSAN